MTQDELDRPSLSPRHWAGWLGVLYLWSIGWAPRKLGLFKVWWIGPLAYRLARRRRRIARRNLERCFPEWSEDQVQMVLRDSFASLARMIAEMSWCWSGPRNRFQKIGIIHGLEHLETAKARGKGVLLVTGHSSCLEIGARILAEQVPFSGVYRPLKNPAMEWYQTRGRLRYLDAMISKRSARQAVKTLRDGGILWYAPDQDFGPEQSEFAPFFGILTASLLATHRLSTMTDCSVVPMYPVYERESGEYHVHIQPALQDFPSEDAVADLSRINATIEEQVRKAPEQYWWVHRRFKTRPEGESPFYE